MARAIAKVILYLIREYPRHSLAAGLSVVILGAILYSQSGAGRGDVTNAISGNAASLVPPVSKLPASEAGPAVVAAPKTGDSDSKTGEGVNPATPSQPEIKDTKAAQTDVAAQPASPAPKGESTPRDSTPPTELAQAGAAEHATPGAAPAPGPASPNGDSAATPLPPPPSDTAKATLLADASAPAPAPVPASEGDQAGKTKATTDVPPDLWIPEAAPKSAAGETSKAVKPGEPALAAAPGGENKSPADSTGAGDAASKAIEPPPASAVEPNPSPVTTRALPTAAPSAAPDSKPAPATETLAPGTMKEIEPPVAAPQADDGKGSVKRPATSVEEVTTAVGDSSAPPPAPAALPEGSRTEKKSANAGGTEALALPVPAPAPSGVERISGNSAGLERMPERSANAESAAALPSATERKRDMSGTKTDEPTPGATEPGNVRNGARPTRMNQRKPAEPAGSSSRTRGRYRLTPRKIRGPIPAAPTPLSALWARARASTFAHTLLATFRLSLKRPRREAAGDRLSTLPGRAAQALPRWRSPMRPRTRRASWQRNTSLSAKRTSGRSHDNTGARRATTKRSGRPTRQSTLTSTPFTWET